MQIGGEQNESFTQKVSKCKVTTNENVYSEHDHKFYKIHFDSYSKLNSPL